MDGITVLLPPKSTFVQPITTHANNEIIFCKEGWGMIAVGGCEYRIEAGQLACIPAGMPHEDRAPEPRQNGHILFPAVGDAILDGFRVFQDQNHAFESLFDLACDAALQNDNQHRALASALCDAIVALIRCWDTNTVQTTVSAVTQIDQLIRQRFSDVDFDLAAEIEKTGYSAGYFRRIFREAFGRPPQAQLNHVRIEYAKAQMRIYRTSASIKRISHNAGFRDPYYFSRMFRQSEGISPTEYLRTISA